MYIYMFRNDIINGNFSGKFENQVDIKCTNIAVKNVRFGDSSKFVRYDIALKVKSIENIVRFYINKKNKLETFAILVTSFI